MIKSAKWIWTSDKERENEYSEFAENFSVPNSEKVILNISCDGVYSVYVNGELAAFSACADYPYYKFYDEIDITKFCEKENEIKIVVWHLGKNSQTYINDKAGMIFEIVSGGEIDEYSGKNTLSRVMNEYKNGYCKTITVQLGQSFLYDNSVAKRQKDKNDLRKMRSGELIEDNEPTASASGYVCAERSGITDCFGYVKTE